MSSYHYKFSHNISASCRNLPVLPLQYNDAVRPRLSFNTPVIRHKTQQSRHFRRYRNNRHSCCDDIERASQASSEESWTMRQITAITVLVLVLLFVIVASRLLDATVSPSLSRVNKTDSSVDHTLSASERLRSGNPPYDRTIKAGGIWFW